MNIGDIVNSKIYVKAAIWCNKNNAHIEQQKDGQYIIVENEPVEPVEITPQLTLDEMNEVLLAIIDRIDGGDI